MKKVRLLEDNAPGMEHATWKARRADDFINVFFSIFLPQDLGKRIRWPLFYWQAETMDEWIANESRIKVHNQWVDFIRSLMGAALILIILTVGIILAIQYL